MKKFMITALISVLTIGVFTPFSDSSNLYSQDIKNTAKETNVKENKQKKKLSTDELKKKKRKDRMKKRKNKQARTRFDRFFPIPAKKLETMTAKLKNMNKLDLQYGKLFNLKSLFVEKNEKGVTLLYAIVNITDNQKSMYDFQVKFIDKNGKEVYKISVPVVPYGRQLKNKASLVAMFKIDEWVGKYDYFDVSFAVPVNPVLKVNDKTSATVK